MDSIWLGVIRIGGMRNLDIINGLIQVGKLTPEIVLLLYAIKDNWFFTCSLISGSKKNYIDECISMRCVKCCHYH